MLVPAAGLSVPVLLMLTALSVYKPWGPIVYQQRAQLKRLKLSRASSVNAITDPARARFGIKAYLALFGILLVAFILHMTGVHSRHCGLIGLQPEVSL